MKKEIKSFKDVWQMPFKNAYNAYIFDSKGKMAFTILTEDESLIERIVSVLNGEVGVKQFLKVGTDKDKQYIAVSDDIDTKRIKPQLLVRGWGYLTGVGGLHLDADQAIALQNELVDYCVSKLKQPETIKTAELKKRTNEKGGKE